MASINYKLRSSKSFETITCPNKLGLSKQDFLQQVSSKMHINPFDMQLEIQQVSFPDGNILQKDNKSEFEKFNFIPAFSSVTLVRIPCQNYEQAKFHKHKTHSTNQKTFPTVATLPAPLPTFSAAETEEEKIKSLLNFDPLENCSTSAGNTQKNRLQTSTPPANYTCHSCGQKGHWKKDCSQQRTIIPRGIPKTMLLKNNTNFALLSKDEETTNKLEPIKSNWLCPICHNLMEDAVSISCCGISACSNCMMQYVENHKTCFSCQAHLPKHFLDEIVANEELRREIKNYQQVKTLSKKKRTFSSIVSNEFVQSEKKIKLITV